MSSGSNPFSDQANTSADDAAAQKTPQNGDQPRQVVRVVEAVPYERAHVVAAAPLSSIRVITTNEPLTGPNEVYNLTPAEETLL